MDDLLTPKQVAGALGVSESTVKRWCDQGVLAAVKTVGGHRRIALEAFVHFARERQFQIRKPELLALPPLQGAGPRTFQRTRHWLFDALVSGQETRAWQLLLNQFMSGKPWHEISDELITPVFHQIGEQWDCGAIEVYQERSACELCDRLIDRLRLMVDRPPGGAPLALGGTPSGDYYTIPTHLVELTLAATGWRAHLLGTNLPWPTLVAAAERLQPQLIWLSVSHIAQPETFPGELAAFAAALHERNVPLALGGRELPADLAKSLPGVVYCATFTELAHYAAGRLGTPPAAPDILPLPRSEGA